jgi:hypothetical protein
VTRITTQIEEAKKLHLEAIERMDESDARIQALPSDAPDSEATFAAEVFQRSMKEADRAAETLERLVAIQRAKTLVPSDTVAVVVSTESAASPWRSPTCRAVNDAKQPRAPTAWRSSPASTGRKERRRSRLGPKVPKWRAGPASTPAARTR